MSSMPRRIHLTSQAVWTMSVLVMAFAGVLFAAVAFVAGVRAADTLAILFMMGAAGTQLVLILFALFNLKRP